MASKVKEPYINFNAVSRANTHYTTVYPLLHWDTHLDILTRSKILVKKKVNMNNWVAIPIE